MSLSRGQTPSIWLFIFVATLLHWGLTFLKQELLKQPQQSEKAPILLEPLAEMERRKPVVSTSKPKEQARESEAKVRFGGEFKNRVAKETKSQRTGRFRQGQKGGSSAKPELDGEQQITMSDLLPYSSSQPTLLPDDILEGNETILNTDPVIYASFINRVRDELYDPWVHHVRQAIHSRNVRGKQVSANLYVTKLKVLLDASGSLISVQTLKSCGVREIDAAPKKAFWEREPFPNPPFDFEETTPHVPLVFEFHFEYRTSSFGIVPWKI